MLDPPPKRRPVRRGAGRPGEARAVAIVALFERAQQDPDIALDLRRALPSLSENARRYLELLVSEGAMPDEAAAQRLETSTSVLADAVAEVEHKIGFLEEGEG